MALHLYAQGWNRLSDAPRPGYSQWRHAQQCWCVADEEDVVGFSSYYRYAYFERANPEAPEHVKPTESIQ